MSSLKSVCFLFSILCITIYHATDAQQFQGNGQQFIRTPSISTLERFNEIPVSLYTGIPNISIPLYAIDYQDIDIPISVSYHAGGIKVDQESSMVGLGWELNGLGVIYRSLNGKDDLNYDPTTGKGLYLNDQIVDFASYSVPTQYYFDQTEISVAPQGTIDFTSYLNDQAADFQPDEFSFSLPGGAGGKFIIDRKGNAFVTERENISIRLNKSNSDYLETQWVITTGDGFQYYFEVADIVQTLSTDNAIVPDYISAWYVTKIVSPQGHTISYTYDQDNYYLIDNTSNFFEQREDFRENVSSSPLPDAQNYGCPDTFDAFQKLPRTNLKQQRLTSIDFHSGKLLFDYSSRVDKLAELKLDMIRLLDYENRLINTFDFDQTYFESNEGSPIPPFLESNDLSRKRLKLSRILIGNSNEKNIYSFDYNESKLPSKYSFSRDHWGYYNASNINTSLIPEFIGPLFFDTQDQSPLYVVYPGADRSVNKDVNQCFILNRINYPTGGHSEFEYETNDYDITKSGNNLKYSIAKGKISYFRSAEGNTNKRIEFIVPETDIDDIPLNYVRVLIKVNVLKDIGDPVTSRYANSYVKITPTSGNSFIHLNESLSDIATYTTNAGNSYYATREFAITLPPGKFYLDVYFDKSIDWIRNADVTYSWIRKPETYAKLVKREYGGGLRVKRISNYDNVTRITTEKNFEYGQIKSGVYRSFGRAMATPIYHDVAKTWGTLRVEAAGTGTDVPVECRHFLRYSNSKYELFSKGVSVGYDTIITVFGSDGKSGGKILTTFYNKPDERIDYGAANPGGLTSFTYPLNGKIHREANLRFDAQTESFDTVSSITHTYSFIATTCYSVYSRKYAVSINQTLLYGQMQRRKWELFFYPVLRSAFIKLAKTKERSYEEDKVNLTEVQYTYEGIQNNKPRKIRTFTSRGEELITDYTYATDFLGLEGDPRKTMAENLNFINEPLEELVTLKIGSNEFVISGILNDFSVNGDHSTGFKVFPSSNYRLKINNNLERSQFQSYRESQSINANLYDKRESFIYNTDNGTLDEEVYNTGLFYSYHWGHSNSYILAKCLNAHKNEFFYTGFEEDGQISIAGSEAHLGYRFYSGDYFLNFEKPNTAKYFYSYWYREDGIWKFSEVLEYNSPILLSIGDAIDDVRVFKEGTKLTTYNYYLVSGLSSETDENEITTHYKYDALGRLTHIKDNNKKVLKQIKYNYFVK